MHAHGRTHKQGRCVKCRAAQTNQNFPRDLWWRRTLWQSRVALCGSSLGAGGLKLAETLQMSVWFGCQVQAACVAVLWQEPQVLASYLILSKMLLLRLKQVASTLQSARADASCSKILHAAAYACWSMSACIQQERQAG